VSFRPQTIALLLVALVAWPLAAKARGCADFVASPAQAVHEGKAATPAGSGAHGLDLANLDRSVSPCRDFYEFADGGWIRSHQIPPGDGSWGLIEKLQRHNREILRRILEREAAARAQAPPGSIGRKLGDFYASCMDTGAIDAAAWKPLEPEFLRIARLRNLGDLESEVARLQAMGAHALFEFGAAPDFRNSSRVIATVYPGGLGLASRGDYLQDDAYSQALRAKYLAHVARMFALLGDGSPRARAEAQTVLRIETRLASYSMSRMEFRRPQAAYRPLGAESLQALTPRFSWTRYFRALGLSPIGAIQVSHPRFFQTMDHELATVPLADWKIYLRWQLIHAFAPDLSAPFVDENFDFYGRALTGATRIRPRWQRCVAAADRELGAPLGRKFVDRTFSPSTRPAALAMVHNLVAAFRKDLQGLYWMEPATRAAAVAKLDRMRIEVGYPDRWHDDSAYPVTAGGFVENMIRGNRVHFRRDLATIGKPADPSRWPIPASAVDPFYDPSMNAIFLPAGIFQPPFFDSEADDALNYGGIGAVIGHEMTHGFDDEGSQFDADGNMKNWWTPQDRQSFGQLAGCVAHQYDSYVAVDDLDENGHLVRDESIADIGGLKIAYLAFETTAEFHSRKKIQGFTPRQRFFLAYARIWTEKDDPQYLRLMVGGNPHASARFRTIGPLSDFEPFAQAFHCRHKDAMVRPEPDRCRIW